MPSNFVRFNSASEDIEGLQDVAKRLKSFISVNADNSLVLNSSSWQELPTELVYL